MSNIEYVKESAAQRAARIAGTGNGATLRTRLVKDRRKYTRKIKHKARSIAQAIDFVFYYISIMETTNVVG